MAIDLKLIDKLLAEYKKPEDILGENGLLKQLTKALLERAMQVEMTEHLGYEKHDPAGNNSGNSRNGATTKTLKGDFGEVPLETPRDRNGSYEPKAFRPTPFVARKRFLPGILAYDLRNPFRFSFDSVSGRIAGIRQPSSGLLRAQRVLVGFDGPSYIYRTS